MTIVRRVKCIRFLARAWSAPHSTLKLRLDHKIEGSRHMSGRKPVLNNKAEDELVSIIKELAQRGFPLDMKEVRTIVYSYAEQREWHSWLFTEKQEGRL